MKLEKEILENACTEPFGFTQGKHSQTGRSMV